MDQHTLTILSIAATTRINTNIEGAPGAGKTETLMALGKALGFSPESEDHFFWMPNPSSADPSDFSGPLAKGMYGGREVSHYMPPRDVVKLQLSKPGKPNKYAQDMGINWPTTGCAAFISEGTTLHPRVQAPLLAMLDARAAIGTHPIQPYTWVVFDSNPPDIATNGQELSMPMLSRMMHIKWPVSVKLWADLMMKGFPEPKIPVVPDEWLAHLPVSRALVASFANKNPESIYSESFFKQLKDSDRGKPYPTLRPWTWFTRANAAWMAMGADEEVRFDMLAGLVGNAGATAFAEYIENEDLPDTREWLEDPSTFKLSKRGDIATISLTSMVAHVCQSKNPKWWTSAWTILNLCMKGNRGDLAIMVCPPLIPLFRENDKMFPITKKDLELFVPMLKASGMIS